jgi:hypothetical protein
MNHSTLIEAQCARSLEMLDSGEKSTIELRLGSQMMPSTRIKELVNKRGYHIAHLTLEDPWYERGYCHPLVAVCALQAEPKRGQ